jgi:hypothetical protein
MHRLVVSPGLLFLLLEFNFYQSQTTYTCGEDGFVRAWKHAGADEMEVSEEGRVEKDGSKKARKDKKRDKGKKKERFKPY